MIAAHSRRMSARWFTYVLVLGGVVLAASPVRAAVRYVNAGGDLQAALNAAQPGDEVVLEAGARFVGNFNLPAKPAGPAITIRSSAALPSRRLVPTDAPLLPIIASPNVAPAIDGTNAANWNFDGLQFESNPLGFYEIIVLQNSTNITMDRLLIVAGPIGQKRAIRGNGRQITLARSHIANIWIGGQDSQAFCAWDGAGPYTLRDNYLEAASENVMFGGANSASPANVPADILVEGNHFNKPLEWRGQPRAVKNLFELKSAKRVTIRNNLFEQNWADAQNGYAILFTVRNDEGGAPWSVVEDVLFERNIVRDVDNGINVLGYDSYKPSGRTTRVTIRHNLFIVRKTFLQAGGEVGTLILDHNTVDQGYNFAMLYAGAVWPTWEVQPVLARFAVEHLIVTNSLGNHNDYGLMGESAGTGLSALTYQTRWFTWTHNVLAGGTGLTYPAITWQPSMAEHYSQCGSDYRLTATSWYRGRGNDGQDLGAGWDGGVGWGGSRPSAPRSVEFIR